MLLGIDAGGSKTTAAIADLSGRILARAEAGPGAVRPGRASEAAAAVFAAGRDALQRARTKPPALAMVVGAAGAASAPERDALAAALEGCGLASRLTVTTDAEIALEGAFGDGPGIVLLAGTGSIAWARLPDGRSVRAGGLGPVLGDHGSGHDLGREALRAIGASLELGIPLDLKRRVTRQLGIDEADLVRWSVSATVAEIAALAPAILDAARDEDHVAHTVAAQGARHLATLVASLARQFPAGAPVRVAWGGGLLAGREDYRAMVLEDVREFIPSAEIAAAPVDAAAGAVAMAKRMTATV